MKNAFAHQTVAFLPSTSFAAFVFIRDNTHHRRWCSSSKIPATASNGKKSSSTSEVAMCSNVNAVKTIKRVCLNASMVK